MTKTESTPVRVGKSLDWHNEGNIDPVARRVIALCDLSNALYTVEQEFEHDDGDEACQLVLAARSLMMDLDRLSLADDAELTLYRECARCSGDGKSGGEDPCAECEGRGYVHAVEAE